MKNATLFQKIFTYIGFTGVALLIPGLLYAAGFPGPIEWIESVLGKAGDRSVVTIFAFALMSLMFIFGGGHNVSATFVGYLIGFCLMSSAIEIDFMDWFRNLSKKIGFLSSAPLNYIVGTATVIAGVLMSFNKKIPFWGEIAGLVLAPIAFLLFCWSLGLFQLKNEFKISIDEGFKTLNGMVDPKYRDMPTVKKFVKQVNTDSTLTKDDKEKKIKELQEKIEKMEEDQRILNELKKKNEEYKTLLDNQKDNLKDFGWCAASKSTAMITKNYAQGVRPEQPCVRDFAVSLVKNEAGPFYENKRGLPGKAGMRQLCALHMHLSSNWKYISDPTSINLDYNSPADRTIAVGLAGDCDDFAVLVASCVEAIGGTSRIVVGECSRGGHAWAEVLLGNETEFRKAVEYIKQYYKKTNMPLSYIKDEQNRYWLSLDWHLGEYTCGERNLKVMYNSEKKDN
jgi:hypothetical protein